MNIDAKMDRILRDSAATIDQVSDVEMHHRYTRFMEACSARTEREVLNQQADMDGYADARDKDLADYEHAERAYTSGDLHTAAEWYRKAAENDFADSALRLAKVLESIVEQHLARPGCRAGSGELFRVVEDASHSYITAYMLGDIKQEELVRRLDRLINYLSPAVATRPGLTIAVDTDPCEDKQGMREPRPQGKFLSPASDQSSTR